MALTSQENQQNLLRDVKFWLPTSNTLEDDQISTMINLVITQVGDDDSQYAEVACKSLKLCGLKNQSVYQIDEGGTKREKTGEVEAEYFDRTGSDPWKRFLKTVNDEICPLIGYNPVVTVGLVVNSKPPKVDVSCTCDDDLTL